MKRVSLLILMCMCIAFGMDQWEKLTKEVHALNLLYALELSKEQIDFIIEKIKQAEELKKQLFSENDTLAEKLRVLEELRDTLLHRKSIPDDLKKRVYRAERYYKELKKKYQDKLTEFALDIQKILEPHQIYVIDHYKPCLIPPKETAIEEGINW